ncbi:MAG: hypothetical protein HYY04_15490 [Chloroflexi bacterium]|nr:hypothetical protein [Chloroflexota bacterium]
MVNTTATANTYDISGGGVKFDSGGNFTDNSIADTLATTRGVNRTISGAGVYVNGNATFERNAIVRNEVVTNGGFVSGAGAYLNATSEMTCNTVANNRVGISTYAGGIYVAGNPTLRSGNIFGNAGYDLYSRYQKVFVLVRRTVGGRFIVGLNGRL